MEKSCAGTHEWTKTINKKNRAEFMKAALKASEIEVEPVLNTKFFDVHQDEWYAKYIVIAKKR